MIKQYNDGTDIVPPKVESVAAANTEVMTPDQDQFSCEYDQSTPKLHNSDVLSYLESKLGHLHEYERGELMSLIREFSQTHIVYHDVDVSEASSC